MIDEGATIISEVQDNDMIHVEGIGYDVFIM